jgi:uncharacterized membrane protein HdeD (DUF308 family)
MTDEEIRKAFSGTPLGVGLLLAGGYWFMFAHAGSNEIALFTCGILAVVLGVVLSAHAMRSARWSAILPSMLFGVLASLTGALIIILSMAPYLP